MKYPNTLIIKKSFKRYYPEDNLLSQIVGFTNIDDKGISGLEAKYNKFLEPVSGSKLSKRNGLGVRISDPTLPTEEAKNGADIVLTINKEFNIAVIGLGQIGSYLLNELSNKKKDILNKTGKKSTLFMGWKKYFGNRL